MLCKISWKDLACFLILFTVLWKVIDMGLYFSSSLDDVVVVDVVVEDSGLVVVVVEVFSGKAVDCSEVDVDINSSAEVVTVGSSELAVRSESIFIAVLGFSIEIRGSDLVASIIVPSDCSEETV